MRRQLRQRRQWFPTACGSESARRRNNAFGQGRTSPARRTASNAWTHVVLPSGRIGVRTAPKRLRKVSKRGSAKDAAVERREATALAQNARNASHRGSGGFSADAHASAAVRARCVRNAPAPLGASASLL